MTTKARKLAGLADAYKRVDAQRMELEREARDLKAQLDVYKKEIQKLVGEPATLDCPLVVSGKEYCIVQVLKHRDVREQHYDYIQWTVK